jgi:hypothetical protein
VSLEASSDRLRKPMLRSPFPPDAEAPSHRTSATNIQPANHVAAAPFNPTSTHANGREAILRPALSLDFLTALGRLSKAEQKAVRTTVSKLLEGPNRKGLRDHKIEHPSGRIFSLSANMDLRILVHRGERELTLLYVDHHDAAYEWARRRKFIETGDQVRILVSGATGGGESSAVALATALKSGPAAPDKEPSAALMSRYRREINDITDDDAAVDFIATLPVSEAERDELLDYAVRKAAGYSLLPRETVEALDDDELQRALELPLDLWRVFLHPRQRDIAYSPPDRSVLLTGGPGTGKTVCIVHRVRHITRSLPDDEVVVLTTYKEHLEAYLNEMLTKLDVDRRKVIVTDVQSFKIVEPDGARGVRLHGFFEIGPAGVFYFEHGRRLRVRHVLFDEYQDFRSSELGGIRRLTEAAPYTIAFDYTQAIYRPPREEVKTLVSKSGDAALTTLTYCYRLNSGIVERLKMLVRAIRVLSAHANSPKARVRLLEFEEELVHGMTAAVSGPPPAVFAYDDRESLQQFLSSAVAGARASFAAGEIVVTGFVSDIYKHLNAGERHGVNMVPADVAPHYRFIATLKGKEFKFGIVILDETICQMLNLNAGVLGASAPSGWRADAEGYRLALNLLYVGLSRFRDALLVCYPKEYGVVVGPLLGTAKS